MSVRHVESATNDRVQKLRSDIASVRASEAELTWEQLSEVEKSAAATGVSPDAW